MSSYETFRKIVDRHGNNEVGRKIGKSKATISQVYHGKYPADPQKIIDAVVEAYAEFEADEVACPELGLIHANVCARYRQWAEAKKVHPDRSYRMVRDACTTCSMKG